MKISILSEGQGWVEYVRQRINYTRVAKLPK